MLKSSKRARSQAAYEKMLRSLVDGFREAMEGLKVDRILVFGTIKYNGVDQMRAMWAKHKRSVRAQKIDLQILDDGQHWSVVFVPKKK